METLIMAIDLKKNRIRIHKATLHLLGDPSSVQFLINPDTKEIGLRNMDDNPTDITVLKISKFQMASDNSIDFYSQKLVKQIVEAAGNMEEKSCYRIYGKANKHKHSALFSFNHVEKILEQV